MTTDPGYYSQLASTYGLSQRKIADKANTSQATVWKIFKGKGEPFYSKDLESRVFQVIQEMVDEKLAALERLKGSTNKGDDLDSKREPKLKRK